MQTAFYADRNGHRTWLKWHRGRRRASDPAFTGVRILEGMRQGASVEVDLRTHAEGGFAILHDAALGRETTGSGLVAEQSAATLRGLLLRDNDGQPNDQNVMLLEDLAALLAEGGIHPDAVLQLDLKEDMAALSDGVIGAFRRIVAPVQKHMILSAGDARAVAVLAEGLAGLRTGYDPCHFGSLQALERTKDFAGFVAGALEAAPHATMIYLDYRAVLAAQDAGFDVIGAFHRAGKQVDAYTIRAADEAAVPVVQRLLELRADQITTDDPEGLGALIAGSESAETSW